MFPLENDNKKIEQSQIYIVFQKITRKINNANTTNFFA